MRTSTECNIGVRTMRFGRPSGSFVYIANVACSGGAHARPKTPTASHALMLSHTHNDLDVPAQKQTSPLPLRVAASEGPEPEPHTSSSSSSFIWLLKTNPGGSACLYLHSTPLGHFQNLRSRGGGAPEVQKAGCMPHTQLKLALGHPREGRDTTSHSPPPQSPTWIVIVKAHPGHSPAVLLGLNRIQEELADDAGGVGRLLLAVLLLHHALQLCLVPLLHALKQVGGGVCVCVRVCVLRCVNSLASPHGAAECVCMLRCVNLLASPHGAAERKQPPLTSSPSSSWPASRLSENRSILAACGVTRGAGEGNEHVVILGGTLPHRQEEAHVPPPPSVRASAVQPWTTVPPPLLPPTPHPRTFFSTFRSWLNLHLKPLVHWLARKNSHTMDLGSTPGGARGVKRRTGEPEL